MAKTSKSDTLESCLITFSCFVLFFISFGVSQSFGVLYVSLLDHFKQSNSDTSWISSIGSGLMLLFGPLAGIIGKKFGIRVTAVIGSIISTIGLVSSSFVESMYFLYVTYGMIVGIGFSFMFNSTNSSVNIYFNKRRNLVAGIASTGIGFGTLVLPVLGSHLIRVYNWRGTFLILAGIVLQGTCCGMLFFPISQRKDISQGSKEHEEGQSIGKDVKEILMKPQFILFTLSAVIVHLMYFVPYVMLPDMVLDYDISAESGALMITISGIANVISRIGFGLVINIFSTNNFIVNGLSLIILGAATSCCYIIEDEYIFFIYAFIVGGTTGVFGICQTILVADILGKNKVQLGFGFLTFFVSMTTIAGPPIVGLIVDRTGSYKTAFLCGGFVFILGGILSILATYRQCFSSRGKYTCQQVVHVQ